MTFPNWEALTDEQLKYWRKVLWDRLIATEKSVERYRGMVRAAQGEMTRRGLSLFED